MKRRMTAILVLLSLSFGVIVAQNKETLKNQPPQREKFDPKRDSEKDLQDAVVVASKTGRRILLDVGGEWCLPCHQLDKFLQEKKDISDVLHKNFVVIKINYSGENKNEKLLSKYPTIEEYPHLFVLDGKGRLLHSQNARGLKSGDYYDHDKVLDFLKKWAPKGTS